MRAGLQAPGYSAQDAARDSGRILNLGCGIERVGGFLAHTTASAMSECRFGSQVWAWDAASFDSLIHGHVREQSNKTSLSSSPLAPLALPSSVPVRLRRCGG